MSDQYSFMFSDGNNVNPDQDNYQQQSMYQGMDENGINPNSLSFMGGGKFEKL